jgi:argininosuccinate lyase
VDRQPHTRMTHLWSGRFDGDPDEALFRFGSSFGFDRRLFEDDVRGSLAWAEALARCGVISGADAERIRAGLEEILEAVLKDPGLFDSEHARQDEDVHAFVERELVSRVGEAGRRLHTGRSRNEQVSTDVRLYLRRRIPTMKTAILRLARALADAAERMQDVVMPSYTHLRRAQPVLAPHYFLAHATALKRDVERFDGVLVEIDELPLGSGAIAGTNYDIDVLWLAGRLGFSRVVANSIDATGDRDFIATFLHACALTMVHASRLAEDLILFTSEEFAFFELADAAATGSSLMPQKKNPDPLELVRGKAGRVLGRLSGWLSTMKGLPLGYSKDLQEDKEAVFEAEDTVIPSLAACASVLDGLTVRRDAALRAASGLLLATDVADYLVSKGVPFRDAHGIVGSLVRRLVAAGKDFDALTLDEWRAHSPLFGEDITTVISADASVRRKRTPQSTNPDRVREALTEFRSWMDEEGRRLRDSKERSHEDRQQQSS